VSCAASPLHFLDFLPKAILSSAPFFGENIDFLQATLGYRIFQKRFLVLLGIEVSKRSFTGHAAKGPKSRKQNA